MEELTRRVLTAMDKRLSPEDKEPCYSELKHIAAEIGATLNYGATRWAFIFKKYGVVYKFPRWCKVEEDYCELEVHNYELGKKYHIEKCLLPITKVGETASGIPIYLQPMYTTSHDGLEQHRRETWERKLGKIYGAPIVRKIRRGCYSSPHDFWVARATQIYGKAFMRSFQAWSKEGQVNDLHSENVGYLGKQPIVIDYAGYHG